MLGKLLLAAAAGVALVAFALPATAAPPQVSNGSAAKICKTITDAGYSPSDYIYVAKIRQQIWHLESFNWLDVRGANPGDPPDGIYQDGEPITATYPAQWGYVIDAEWVYMPIWDGAEDARMSRIWGSVQACAA